MVQTSIEFMCKRERKRKKEEERDILTKNPSRELCKNTIWRKQHLKVVYFVKKNAKLTRLRRTPNKIQYGTYESLNHRYLY